MYHNALDEFASWPMVLTTAQVVEGIRSILAAARSDPSLKPADVTEELTMMLARDDSNPEPLDVAVCREIEDWVVSNWQEDSPELVDAMSVLVLMRRFELSPRIRSPKLSAIGPRVGR
jgi:hypothetical protein